MTTPLSSKRILVRLGAGGLLYVYYTPERMTDE